MSLTAHPSRFPVRRFGEMTAEERTSILQRVAARLGHGATEVHPPGEGEGFVTTPQPMEEMTAEVVPEAPPILGEGERETGLTQTEPSMPVSDDVVDHTSPAFEEEDEALAQRIKAFLQARRRPATEEQIVSYLEAQDMAEYYKGLAEAIRDYPIEVSIDRDLPMDDLNRYRLRSVPRRYGRRSWKAQQALAALRAEARRYLELAQALIEAS